MPALGCPCSSPGTLACNGAHQALRLKCTAGVWVDNTTCVVGQNCDQGDGLCHTIIANCQTSSTYCSDGNTQQTCNADLTATTPTACVGVCSSNLCQTAKCGDGKVEASLGEECDDGNTVASDGCEPDCKLSKVIALAAGAGHSCVLLSSGAAKCWGDNQYSQLGLGDTAFHGTTQPYQLGPITFGEKATAIASGLYHVCVVLASGGVRCWGRNEMGQLGQGDTTARTTPAPVITFNSPVQSIAAGGETTCAILQNGDVHCWGANGSGMLGLGTINEPSQSTAATALGAIAIGGAATAISVGTDAVCASRSSGVICWGYNGSGELGRGDTVDVGGTGTPAAATPPVTPVLASGRTATALASGAGHTCALQDNNQLECWGSNAAGQLGLGLPASGTSLYIGDNEAPATSGVLQLTGVTSVYASNSSTCAKLLTGGLRCWGLNTKGELGYADVTNKGNDNTTKPSNLPDVAFGSGVTATSVALGNAHTCALLSNGQVRCWGRDQLGQLGNASLLVTSPDYVGGNSSQTPDLLTPVQIFPPSP
jgi:cysteine-rich repeat protein